MYEFNNTVRSKKCNLRKLNNNASFFADNLLPNLKIDRTNHRRRTSDYLDIRGALDEKLNITYSRIATQNISGEFDQSRIQIPKDLVVKYIRQIYVDYNIRDPLTGISTQNTNRRLTQRSCRSQRCSKAVLLKQSFVDQLTASEAYQSNRKYSEHSDRNRLNSRSTQHSQPFIKQRTGSSTRRPSLTIQNDRNLKNLQQCFRYCFICQQPILQANIEFHQRQQCSQFAKVYSLSLYQIKDLVRQKINRLKKEIRILLGQIKSKEHNQQSFKRKIQIGAGVLLSVCQQNLREVLQYNGTSNLEIFEEYQKNQKRIKDSYNRLVKQYNNPLITILEVSNKLKWFGIMFTEVCKFIQYAKGKNVDSLFKRIQLVGDQKKSISDFISMLHH